MRRVAAWLAAISLIIFVFIWMLIGIMIYEGEYLIQTQLYIALFSLGVFFASIIVFRITKSEGDTKIDGKSHDSHCPHCGRKLD